MKKTLQLFVALLVTATMSAQFDDGTFTYTILDDTTCEITGWVTVPTANVDVDVPATALDTWDNKTYNVTKIGDGAFSANDPDGAKPKGERSDLANLFVQNVTLPASVTVTGPHSFRDNPNLLSINLDNVVTTESNGFAGCTSLSSIGSIDNIVSLGDYTFNMCTSLTTLEFSSALESIGVGAIYNSGFNSGGTGGVMEFNIPSSVTNIGNILLGRLWQLSQVQLNWTAAELANVTMGADNFFRNLDLSTIKLYVPVGTKGDYEGHVMWGTFPAANIIEGAMPVLSTNNLEQALGFKVYPNPTTGIVSINNSQLKDASITVYDLNGRSLLSRNINDSISEINISNLASGLYIFRIKSGNSEVVKRIMKK